MAAMSKAAIGLERFVEDAHTVQLGLRRFAANDASAGCAVPGAIGVVVAIADGTVWPHSESDAASHWPYFGMIRDNAAIDYRNLDAASGSVRKRKVHEPASSPTATGKPAACQAGQPPVRT